MTRARMRIRQGEPPWTLRATRGSLPSFLRSLRSSSLRARFLVGRLRRMVRPFHCGQVARSSGRWLARICTAYRFLKNALVTAANGQLATRRLGKSGCVVAWPEHTFDRSNDLVSARGLADYGGARPFIVDLLAPRIDHTRDFLLVQKAP